MGGPRCRPAHRRHGHQAKARCSHSGKLAAVAPGDTTPAAARRRLERMLADDRLDPKAAWPPWRTPCTPASAAGRWG
ncbi:MAG: hypothetical protein IRY99_22265 [Isosphaeraceae bacterium]|nr:hypothetical protein [Isosphaeraceae bacterium]